MLTHWLLLRRLMGVSGRFTALIDALRLEPPLDAAMSEAEFLAALEAETRAEFGDEALAQLAAEKSDRTTQKTAEEQRSPTPLGPQPLGTQLIFLVCLVGGGLLAALVNGKFALALELRSELFLRFFGRGLGEQIAVLIFGGMLVGAGTRMAGGCTSGHGLCGVSRLQTGSVVATAAFFLAGAATSFLLARLVR